MAQCRGKLLKCPTAVLSNRRSRLGSYLVSLLALRRSSLVAGINCQEILGGLRSACTYVGASKLKELSKRTTFVRVTQQLNQVCDPSSSREPLTTSVEFSNQGLMCRSLLALRFMTRELRHLLRLLRPPRLRPPHQRPQLRVGPVASDFEWICNYDSSHYIVLQQRGYNMNASLKKMMVKKREHRAPNRVFVGRNLRRKISRFAVDVTSDRSVGKASFCGKDGRGAI